MADIVKQLRDTRRAFSPHARQEHLRLTREAADEIERLQSRLAKLEAVAEAARVFRELYEMEDANANDVGGGLEDLFAALDGEKE